MAKKQDDRRIRKTKRALREGLAELMGQKDIHSITVKELADKADIHRSTFYAHYEDIYDLYHKLEEGVIEELSAVIAANFSLSLSGYYAALFDYVEGNKKLCKLLFSGNSAPGFTHRLALLLKSACLKSWCGVLGLSEVSEDLDYYALYHLQGCFAMISKWVSVDFAYAKERMVRLMAELDTNMERYLKQAVSRGAL